jgi:hypothetical protein
MKYVEGQQYVAIDEAVGKERTNRCPTDAELKNHYVIDVDELARDFHNRDRAVMVPVQ